MRLPTEAEWEFACRAGTTTTYYTGDTEADLGQAAWYSANSGGKTHPVGQKAANAWGLHDMHGNVYEWCRDRSTGGAWGDYEARPATDPEGPANGAFRVVRGGSWRYTCSKCRSTSRGQLKPDSLASHTIKVVHEIEYEGKAALFPFGGICELLL